MISEIIHIATTILIYIVGLALSAIIIYPLTFGLYTGKRYDLFDDLRKRLSMDTIRYCISIFSGLILTFFITNFFYGHLLSATALFLTILLCVTYGYMSFILTLFFFTLGMDIYIRITKPFRSAEMQRKWENQYTDKETIIEVLTNACLFLFCFLFSIATLWVFNHFHNPVATKIITYISKFF